MKELIVNLVRLLVDQPDKIRVAERREGNLTVLELKVAEDDYGKVIGKQGATVKAIRSLLSAASAKKGLRYNLEVVE